MDKSRQRKHTTTASHNIISIWPSADEEQLLQAALLQGNEARQALYAWTSHVDVARLDHASKRLLPLLHHNTTTQGIRVNDQLAALLKRRYYLTWGTNQIVFHTLSEILRHFHEAGIATMLLKGTALAVAYYHDYGLRPMDDFDVLVPADQMSRATDVLRKSGWKMMPRRAEYVTEDYLSIVHSHPFRKKDSLECDLHWHVLPECCRADDDKDFWQKAVPIEVNGFPTCILHPADQVLHICVHGLRWGAKRSIHWISDAMRVLRQAEQGFDWERLLEQAQQRRLILPIREALTYLATNFQAPIPPDILQRWQALPVSRMEQFEYRYKCRNHRRPLLGYMPLLWLYHSRLCGEIGTGQKILGFPGYLRRFWGVSSTGEFFQFLVKMTLRKLRGQHLWLV